MCGTNNQEMILKQAKIFADEEIRPRAGEFDREGALDKDLIEKMAERKYLLASIPEQYGGLGLDPLSYGLFTEEIGKACCASRTIINIQSALVGEALLKWGSEKQRKKYLPLMASGNIVRACSEQPVKAVKR